MVGQAGPRRGLAAGQRVRCCCPEDLDLRQLRSKKKRKDTCWQEGDAGPRCL